MLGAAFDEPLLQRVAASRAAARPLDRSSRPTCSSATGRRRGPVTGSPTRSCTRSVYQNLLWRAAPSCTSGSGAALERAARRAPRAAERPRGARPPLEPQRGQAPGRALPGGRRRLGARGLRQRGRDPPLRARAPHPRRLRRRSRRSGASRASGWPTCSGSPGGGPRRSAHYEAVRRRLERGGGSRGRRRGCSARSAGCTGKPATASAPAPASRPGSSCSARTAIRSSARISSRRWAGWPSAPATTPAPSPGPSARWPTRAARRRRRADAERAREAAAMRAQAYNTLGVALARTGPARRGGGADRAQHRAGRGARPAAGRLPRLHEPRRALQLARPAPAASRPACAGSRRRRRSATSASSRASTRTSRSPTAR